MTNQWIAERYELTQQIMQSDDGTWYRAIDTSLKREIMILITDAAEHATLLQAQRDMKEAAQLSNEEFLQILNAGHDDQISYIIFQAISGTPLYQYAENHAVTLRTVLQWVFRAGQLLQQGQLCGLSSFSVSFDNLWITDDHELVVMNYWKQARSSRTGTQGLLQLLYQCCTLHALAPRQLDVFISRIQSSLKHEQPVVRESVITLAKRVYEDEPSIMSFMIMLKEMIDQPAIPIKDERPQSYNEEPTVSDDTIMFASPALQQKQRPVRPEPESTPTAADARHQTSNLEELMTAPGAKERNNQQTRDHNNQPSSTNRRSSKMKIIAAITGCVLFISLIGGAVLWANSLSKDDETAQNTESVTGAPVAGDTETSSNDQSQNVAADQNGSTDSTDSSSQDTENTDSQNQATGTEGSELKPSEPNSNNGNSSTDNSTENNNNNNNDQSKVKPDQPNPVDPGTTDPVTPPNTGETTKPETPPTGEPAPEGTAPNLVGLTLEEAEKQARAAGLKYSYEKKNAEGQEAGKVFQQEPAAGTPVKKGDRITFYIARDQKK
ncbi:PASTA domain-containing protein [Paenibacillus marinisediminis]